MFTTHTTYLSTEVDYRREELTRAWNRSRPVRSRKAVQSNSSGASNVALASSGASRVALAR